MPDFSPSGFYQMPTLTTDGLAMRDPQYHGRLMGWLDEALVEGDAYIQGDINYDEMAKGMAYVSGEQTRDAGGTGYDDFKINMCRRAAQAHVSALTDIKPTFGWRSMNPKYAATADLCNKLAVAWYLNNMADVSFGNVMKMAWAAGTADMQIEWDATAPGGGDHRVIPRDPRDTIPIRPSRYGGIQSWRGLTIREVHSINVLRDTFPQHAHLFAPTPDTLLGTVKGLLMRSAANKYQTPADPLSALSGVPRAAGPLRPGDCILYSTYLTDRSRNLTSRPIVVGDPTKPWSYTVEPQQLLYPRKRLIIRTEHHILYDGPNPYWHGMFPIVRFSPWQLPWAFFGEPALKDLTPIQDAVNKLGRNVLNGIDLWVNAQHQIDMRAVGEAAARMYNPRKPGQRVRINSAAVDPDKAFKKIEGPNPQVLAMATDLLASLRQVFEAQAGTGNLEALLQLKQMPAENTVERFYQAMTPELRLEGRMFEAFLRDGSRQILYNTFQFQTQLKRVHMLGDAAALLEDFDADPGTLVPALDKLITDPMSGLPMVNPEYDPMFDKNLPRAQRAQAMAGLMAFIIAPNSVLAFNAQEEKMMDFQLSRMGYLDFWTLMERLERPNVGQPPPIPLPATKPPANELELAEGIATGRYIMGPGGVMELRVPITITERLMAQQLLGIGMTANPAGRKASGDAPPKQETKDGGSRTTITESQK